MNKETKKVLFVLLNEYTDWEGAFLSTALHVGVIPGSEIKYRVHTVAPTLDAVCSIGGFKTLPDYSFENMPKDYAALVLIGGNRWDSPEAELVAPLVQEALDKGKIVGRLVRNDTGGERARSLGIQLTPAVVLVVPPDKMGLIAHGAVSLDELEEKIVTAAIDMKVVDPKLAQTAKMNERGMIDRNDWEAAGITGEESPDELADKIYNIIGRKMGQAK